MIRPSPSVLTDDDDDGSDVKTPCSDRTTSRESLVHGVLTSLLAKRLDEGCVVQTPGLSPCGVTL